MALPISVQLYSVRDYIARDGFAPVLKRIADIGYKGVEPAGFFNLRPSELKKMTADLGLEIYSSHSPWAHNAGGLPEQLDIASILGLDTIVCGYGPDNFKDLDSIKKTADNTNAMVDFCSKNGFTLFQHNHYWEFERIDGRLKYDIYRELCPGVKYQIDSFWSTNKGTEDAVAMLKEFAKDTILIHMKDGVCRQEAKNDGMKDGLLDMKIDLLPLGTGTLPIKDIIAAAPAQVKTVVVELDYCESCEMFKALEISYKFMTENGIAAGNK
ncbi:MAG: sugar phosphate isomerase/epimerase [Kiritimatiellae bacterium]|nr:sugar phosphate isomerase/epimerase [Kiritimatiellia bacterium]